MKQTEIDQLEAMYLHYDFKCFVTGNQATQRAHIIGDTIPNRKLYGDRIIDNPLNWLPVDTLESNALVDLGKKDLLNERVTLIIDSLMDVADKRSEIELIVRVNIAEKQAKSDTGKVLHA